MSDDCERCGGSRHVFDQETKGWVQCDCLGEGRSRRAYAVAGIPVRLRTVPWSELFESYEITRGREVLIRTAHALKRGETPESILVHGKPKAARNLIMSLVIRAACDGEQTSKILDLPTLIDAEFNEERRGQRLYQTEVMAIRAGTEAANRYNRVVFEKALREREERGLFTLVISEVDAARLPTRYKSRAIETALQDMDRVTVAPKDAE